MEDKTSLLEDFRRQAEEKYSGLSKEIGYKEKAKIINSAVLEHKESMISNLDTKRDDCLSNVMLISYVAYIVMLEYRNKAWPYEYMAFSRRIGEIWEPFCKLPFIYPTKALKIVDPPVFEDVKITLNEAFKKYINSLPVNEGQKDMLMRYHNKTWRLVDSGNISLSLDLHFQQDNVIYNVDFKSGFGSNEKGNTNRLLQVGSIYDSISVKEKSYKNLIFVRQAEDKNNHYLKKLKDSPYWSVYCAEEAYNQIRLFTGFDIKKWMTDNMVWMDDISDEFRRYLKQNGLIDYLVW